MGVVVRIQPVVLLSILDHYMRRNNGQARVIGTLMGVVSEDGSEIIVKNCFPVSHTESEENVGVNAESHHTMLDLFYKVNDLDVIVGWYATGNLNANSALIHEFFRTEAKRDTIHLLVNTELQDDPIKTFLGALVGSQANPAGVSFLNIPNSIQIAPTERIALDFMAANKSDDSSLIKSDTEHLKTLLKNVSKLASLAIKTEGSAILDQSIYKLARASSIEKSSQDLAAILQAVKLVKLNLEVSEKQLQ